MPQISPLSESEAGDKTGQTYQRIKEVLGVEAVPAPFLTLGRVPAFLQDFYMNFKKFVWGDGKLGQKERLLIALATAANAGRTDWIEFLRELAGERISDQEYAELSAVVAACGMYNAFFKFREMSGSELFGGMSVGLRAHVFSGTSLDERVVELINTVISDLNACKPCTEGHVTKSRQLGLSDEAILEAIQIAATIQSGVKYAQAAG
jgi:lipoyl-dependent peroxiredoxin subunit D